MARADPIVASFASVVEPHSRILDIGAGKGHLALQMAQQFGARVVMVDIARYNETHLPLTVCDSRALAFANDSFDTALLSFVLHHSRQPEVILGEALRVARQVIVVENHVPGKLRGWLTCIVDSWPAVRYGTPPCYVARSRPEWLTLFQRLPVTATHIGDFKLELGFFDCFTVVLRRSEAG